MDPMLAPPANRPSGRPLRLCLLIALTLLAVFAAAQRNAVPPPLRSAAAPPG